ncbi:MAG TPA: phosphocholine cytidylyltransferase family protein [Pyrinomonadaceae bacterium]|jgi:choline kinase|nr:phosphocholine cytidylyltransferase family protein [Pyrinomonadaceae bacterium]
MKAIILAAGKGTRLDGAAVKPKCLVEIGGISLLQRQIDALRDANIKRIVVVVGFGAGSIREECGSEITFVENIHFAETSSLYSLWLAREHLADGFVVLNSDVLFHPQLLANLLESSRDDALLLSDTDPTPLGDEEMKVKLKEDLVIDISKDMDPVEANGENVGIVKFSAPGAKVLVSYMDQLIASGAVKDWAPRAFREFALNHPLHALSTGGLPWIEIDFPEDYQRAVKEIYPRIESALSHDEALTEA